MVDKSISAVACVLIGAVIGGLVAITPIEWSNLAGLGTQNIILFVTMFAALGLWMRTRHVAINRETMDILVKMETDSDLLKTLTLFNRYQVCYEGRLGEFSTKPSMYNLDRTGVQKSALDTRPCKCSCQCEELCQSNQKCECQCDKKPNRVLSLKEYQEVRTIIMRMLNWNELIALGIAKGAYHEKIYKDYWRTTFVRQLIYAADYIRGVRPTTGNNNASLYVLCEKLAYKWAKDKEVVELNSAFGRDSNWVKGKH